MMGTMMETEHSCLELWQVFAITPLERSEAFRMMTSLAFALSDLHDSAELWDHCEKGVIINTNSHIKITGTVSNRSLRLKGEEVDPYRSIAPPEFIISGEHDERSDIFAWGIIAYELVTGECPVKGESLNELIENATRCEFPSPHILRTDWPERLSMVIMKALSKDPDDRYQNVQELIRAMNNV
jgi:eukaryotic-like serine/threonine-protein kinase